MEWILGNYKKQMAIKDKIMEDYKQAMRQKDELKKNILNYIISQIRYKRIELGRDLTDEEVVQVIKKEIKARKEAYDLYVKSGNEKVAQDEAEAIKILESYLPKQLSEEELVELVKKYVKEL